MSRREFIHDVDAKGKPVVVEIPRHLRGRSEYDAGSYTENVIARRAGEAASAAAGAVARRLFGGNR